MPETSVAVLEQRIDNIERDWKYTINDIAHHVTIVLGMATHHKIEIDRLKADFRRLDAKMDALAKRVDTLEAKVV